MKRVAVIGLGYVGLPLALLADVKGFLVTGVDLDAKKISGLKKGESPLEDTFVTDRLKNNNVDFTSKFEDIREADIAVICVPTPVDKEKMPDLSLVKNATLAVAKNLKKDSLLIIESTINPGVCDEVLIPLIEKETEHIIGSTIYVAHCPERINPGDAIWHVGNINRVLGADGKKGLELAYEFYTKLINAKIKKMGTLKEAESVKIIENAFRDINIAFVNELAMSFHKMDINLENVIEGASTKPFAFMAHHPGCGVGGHCIPVDPYYLIERAKGFGFEHKFLQAARDINESMPEFTISLLDEALGKLGLNKSETNILVLGQAYKADVSDARESPAITIYNSLASQGYTVKRHDPYALDKSDFETLEEALEFADSAILATGHSTYRNLTAEMLKTYNLSILIDGRNLFRHELENFKKNDILYQGIGVSSQA